MSIKMAAVKGRMRNNEYWVGSLDFAAIEKFVKLPEDDHWDEIFGVGQEEAQRRLNRPRVAGKMVPYLKNDDAFFSSLTMIMVPMDGSPLEEGEHFTFKPLEGSQKAGELEIENMVDMFPADGQHRSATIIEALKQNKALFMREEVPVVILPFKSKDQVRQLFSDLNQQAKVATSIARSFETRDPVVVATKRVMRDVALFENRVNEQTTSLAKKSPDVITMNTLVLAHEAMLEAMFPVNGKGRTFRDHEALQTIRSLDPSDTQVADVSDKLRDVWDVVIGAIPQWEDIVADRISARELREGEDDSGNGGYVFAYGIGWQAIGLVAAALIRHRPDDWSEELARAIESVDWQKGPQWNGIAMVGSRVNNTAPGVKATAGYVLEQAGFTAEDGVKIKEYLGNLASSRESMQMAA
jgi:DNA sulfur modification protein DndB